MKGEQRGGKERMISGRDKNAIEETAKKEVCVQGDDGRGKKESNKAEHTEEMEAEGKTRDQIGWRKRRKMAGGEVLLPACSAESSQQVGARASPWPPSDWRLCSAPSVVGCWAHISQEPPPCRYFMQITVRPGSGLSVLPQIQSVSADLRPCEDGS